MSVYGKQIGYVAIGIVGGSPRAQVTGCVALVTRTAAVPAGSYTITLGNGLTFARPEMSCRAQAYGAQFSAGVIPGPAANQLTLETRNAAGALTDTGVDLVLTRQPPTGATFPNAVA